MKISVAVICFLVPFLATSQKSDAVIQFGESLRFHSEILNENREVWVYLPPNYNDTYHQPQDYPVLYVLDGDAHFQSVSGMIQILGAGVNGTYVIPEMIVVAVLNTNRERDLAPHTDHAKNPSASGRMAAAPVTRFLRFIREELIPQIETRYRSSELRMLIGQSLGGLTVINALLSIPNTFNAYVAIEPSLWWEDKVLLNYAKSYFAQTDLSGTYLFLAQANTLNPKDSVNLHHQSIKEFLTILETRNRSKLKWKYRYYEHDTHGSVALAAEYDALRFVFRGYHARYETINGPQDLEHHYTLYSDELKMAFIAPERVVQRFGTLAGHYGQHQLARQYYQMNTAHYPRSASAHVDLGNLLLKEGKKAEALQLFKKALQLDADNPFLRSKVTTLEKK